MENLLFEIKYTAEIKHSTALNINSLIEQSLISDFSEEKIKLVQRLSQDLLDISKKLDDKKQKLFYLQITKNNDKLNLIYETVIPKSEMENISNQLDIVNKTIPDSEAFKQMYKTKLRTGIIAGNRSVEYPDLNLIDLGRELKEKVNFSFTEIDFVYSFFKICIVC